MAVKSPVTLFHSPFYCLVPYLKNTGAKIGASHLIARISSPPPSLSLSPKNIPFIVLLLLFTILLLLLLLLLPTKIKSIDTICLLYVFGWYYISKTEGSYIKNTKPHTPLPSTDHHLSISPSPHHTTTQIYIDKQAGRQQKNISNANDSS